MNVQPGTIQAIYNSQRNNPLYKSPVLQITSLNKLIMGENEKHRYKANLSDGQYYMKAVFSSELSHLFDECEIQKFYLIKLNMFTVRPKDNNNYLYVQSISENKALKEEIGKPANIASGKYSLEPAAENIVKEENKTNNVKTKVPEPQIQIKRASTSNETPKKQKDGDNPFTSIKDLNPFQNKWIIKGRVVSKSDIRKFNSAKGEGKLFSFEIADKTAQVKCVAFSESVDVFFPLIEVNKVYTISQGTIKMANKKYSSNNFDYEIQLEKISEIQMIEDDDIPQYVFNFVKISDLSIGPSLVDVIGIIKEVYPTTSITTKSTGQELNKRDILLVDETGNIRLTLWGAKCDEQYEKDTALALKAVKVGEYNGLTLSTITSSQIVPNPNIPEALDLIKWYKTEGVNIVIEKPKKATKKQFIAEIKENELEYATINATIMYVKEDNLFYESCIGENCSKKVSMEDNGRYRCERCNYIYDSCDYRYMLNVHVGDATGQIWITIFDEAAKVLLGVPAKQLKELSEESPTEMQNVIKSLVSKELQFRIKAKEDNYNGETKMRYSCLEAVPIDYDAETKKMLKVIETLNI